MQECKPLCRPRRFRAVRTRDPATGCSFDSLGERRRWKVLLLLQAAGRIADLELHPRVTLLPPRGAAPAVTWRVDFSYTENGARVWEEFKRPQYNMKRRIGANGKIAGHKKALWTQWDRKLLVLWGHFGPGLLRVVGRGGEAITTVVPEPKEAPACDNKSAPAALCFCPPEAGMFELNAYLRLWLSLVDLCPLVTKLNGGATGRDHPDAEFVAWLDYRDRRRLTLRERFGARMRPGNAHTLVGLLVGFCLSRGRTCADCKAAYARATCGEEGSYASGTAEDRKQGSASGEGHGPDRTK